MVSHEGGIVGNPGLLRKTQRRKDTGIRHGHDEIGLHGMQPRQLTPHIDAGHAHIGSADIAVRPGKIHMLKNAKGSPVLGERPLAAQAIFIDDHHLAGLHIANELGMDQIKRATLGGQHIRPVKFSQAERAEAVRIPKTNDLPLAHEDDRKGSLQTPQGRDAASVGCGLGEQMQDDLAIHRRLKNRTTLFELGPEGCRIHKIAVVGDCEATPCRIHDEGLRIFEIARTGRRIANVPDGAVALQFLEITRLKNLGYESHAFVCVEGRRSGFR